MTRQLSLFDTPPEPAAPPSLARRSDPATSHEAAAGVVGKRQLSFQRCLAVIRCQPRALTAQEIAALCVQSYGGIADTYRKRPHELTLEENGSYLVECETRVCSVTKANAVTFRRNPNGPGI